MNKQWKLIPAILGAWVCSALFSGCAVNVAGSGTDYPNTKVSGMVHSSADAPVSGARVQIIDDANWLADIINGQPVVLDSARTNAAGAFAIRRPASRIWNIQIDSRDEGLLTLDFGALVDSTKDTTYQFTLKPYATLSGTVQPDAGTPQSLALSGSSYGALVNADKSYSFPTLAAGAYVVVTGTDIAGSQQRSLGASIQMSPGAVVAGQTLPAPVNRVLVDDFSIGQYQTNIGRTIGDGWWYTVNDSVANGHSTISLSFVAGAEAYAGQSMRAVYTLDPQSAGPWALMGFFLGRDSENYDLSNLTALSFMAKGTGTVEVRFYSKMVDSVNGNTWQQFSYVLPLPAAWTPVTIPADSLQLPANSPAFQQGYTWAQVAPTIQIIYFIAYTPQNNPGDTITMYLDNVSLDGIKLETFVK
jgi:hypothetical protein